MEDKVAFLNFKKLVRQFLIYLMVGALTNTLVFVAYLFLTSLWAAPKSVMTILFFGGAVLNFTVNRKYTFAHHGHIRVTTLRYFIAYITGYLLNLLLL